jgi:hypothetical protein
MSDTLADKCHDKFTEGMVACFKADSMRVMTPEDAKSVVQLHCMVHGVDGLAGSLECMHYDWLKCLKAWQGVYKRGDQKYPSLVLEAMCDYNLWFWHAFFGLPGTFNDISILQLSPLFNAFIDGSFKNLDIDVMIGGKLFKILVILVDSIYPPLDGFLQGLSSPVTDVHKYYTKWQESVRKDIERGFGVIGKLVESCLIIHNMMVEEHVMGIHTERYCPSHGVHIDQPDCSDFMGKLTESMSEAKTCESYECSKIGVKNLNETTQKSIIERWYIGWKKTNNHTENLRLREGVAHEVHQKRKCKHCCPNINIVVAHYYYYYHWNVTN